MKRLLLTLTLLVAVVGTALAQSVTINKIWLEKDVSQNSKLGMKIHFYLRTDGLKDVPLSAIAYFDEPKGVGVKDTDGYWRTSGGTVAVWADFTPPYENSVWNDFWFFVAYEDIHIKDYSKTYYCHVFIFDKHGKQYGNSEYVSFQVEKSVGTSANNHAQYAHLIPSPGSMVASDTYYYYKDQYNNLADIRIFFNNEWKANCYLYTGSGDGTLYYFEKVYHDGSRWIFKEILQGMTGHQGSNATLYISNDWSYIQVDNYKFNIPVSQAEFKQLLPRASGDGGGNYNPGGGNYNSGSGSTSSFDNKKSESYYRDMYSLWERSAERAYNSLTALGASITYSDGSKEGSTLGSWSSSDYTRLKQDLRNAQSEMRAVRSEASRDGYHITPSHWETATVGY